MRQLRDKALRFWAALKAALRAFRAEWRIEATIAEVEVPAFAHTASFVEPERFKVFAEGQCVHVGGDPTEARKCYEKHQDPSKYTEVIITDRGEKRGHWKRGW